MKIVFLLGFFWAALSLKQPSPNGYVFWGDSIMAGNELNHSGSDGPNNTFLRWPRQYAEGIKGGVELNNAQSGSTLCNNWGGNGPFENRISEVDVYDPSRHNLLFIGYGFNDFSRALSPPNSLSLAQFLAVFIPKLKTSIDYLKTTKQWPAANIVIVWNYIVDNPPYYVTQADWETTLAAVRSAVAIEGVCLLDFHSFWKARSDRANYSDGDLIHPNEASNTIMAAHVDELIEHPSKVDNPVPPGLIRVTGKKLVVH